MFQKAYLAMASGFSCLEGKAGGKSVFRLPAPQRRGVGSLTSSWLVTHKEVKVRKLMAFAAFIVLMLGIGSAMPVQIAQAGGGGGPKVEFQLVSSPYPNSIMVKVEWENLGTEIAAVRFMRYRPNRDGNIGNLVVVEPGRTKAEYLYPKSMFKGEQIYLEAQLIPSEGQTIYSHGFWFGPLEGYYKPDPRIWLYIVREPTEKDRLLLTRVDFELDSRVKETYVCQTEYGHACRPFIGEWRKTGSVSFEFSYVGKAWPYTNDDFLPTIRPTKFFGPNRVVVWMLTEDNKWHRSPEFLIDLN